MLNIIWPVFIIISIIYAIASGNIEKLNSEIFESCDSAIKLSLTFLGTMCLWNGLMKIVQETTLIDRIKKLLRPLMRILFPRMNKNSKEYEEISMNIIANMLGLGNAATPLGIRAMKTMQEKNDNKKEISDNMAMFIIINTISIQIIPTTIIAIRNSLGSENPNWIIVPVWISTICATVSGIIVSKILIGNRKKKFEK